MAVAREDTAPLAGAWVVLHQVVLSGGQPVDSGRTDAAGAYYLHAPVRDTTAIYLASVEHRGINYFSSAVRAVEFTMDTAATLFVFDTTSVGPAITVAQKHVVVRSPEANGSRSVLELLVLHNRGQLARVVGDSAVPVWRGALPEGATNLEVGESDVSRDAVVARGDTVMLFAPVPPGEKQLVYAYTIPSGRRTLNIPVDQPVERLQVLLEDTLAQVESSGLQRFADEQMEGVTFARYEGAATAAGGPVGVRFPSGGTSAMAMWWIPVALAGLAMGAALVVWLRRGPRPVVVVDDPNVLAARIAALDEEFEARAGQATPGERAAYGSQRSELKARLSALLAERRPRG